MSSTLNAFAERRAMRGWQFRAIWAPVILTSSFTFHATHRSPLRVHCSLCVTQKIDTNGLLVFLFFRKRCRESEKHTETAVAAGRVHRQKHEIYVETSELENVFFGSTFRHQIHIWRWIWMVFPLFRLYRFADSLAIRVCVVCSQVSSMVFSLSFHFDCIRTERHWEWVWIRLNIATTVDQTSHSSRSTDSRFSFFDSILTIAYFFFWCRAHMPTTEFVPFLVSNRPLIYPQTSFSFFRIQISLKLWFFEWTTRHSHSSHRIKDVWLKILQRNKMTQ